MDLVGDDSPVCLQNSQANNNTTTSNNHNDDNNTCARLQL
jgi:hypothetical protein